MCVLCVALACVFQLILLRLSAICIISIPRHHNCFVNYISTFFSVQLADVFCILQLSHKISIVFFGSEKNVHDRRHDERRNNSDTERQHIRIGSKIQNCSKSAKYFFKWQCLIWNSELEWNTLKRLLNLEEEKLVELWNSNMDGQACFVYLQRKSLVETSFKIKVKILTSRRVE